MKWKGSLKNRIQHALAAGPLSYPSLMRAVFPVDKYPNAFNRSANGGPPVARWYSAARSTKCFEMGGWSRWATNRLTATEFFGCREGKERCGHEPRSSHQGTTGGAYRTAHADQSTAIRIGPSIRAQQSNVRVRQSRPRGGARYRQRNHGSVLE